MTAPAGPTRLQGHPSTPLPRSGLPDRGEAKDQDPKVSSGRTSQTLLCRLYLPACSHGRRPRRNGASSRPPPYLAGLRSQSLHEGYGDALGNNGISMQVLAHGNQKPLAGRGVGPEGKGLSPYSRTSSRRWILAVSGSLRLRISISIRTTLSGASSNSTSTVGSAGKL